jgi:4-diphosphocytidyl-2-C-methyl-D-erythritol kinase
VAFFLYGGTALGEGRGEKITKWVPSPVLDLVLVKQEEGLATSKVYGSGLGEFSPGRLASAFKEILETGDKKKIGRSLHNGLERAACHFVPNCMDLKMELKEAGALGALVTGSGPTVYGLAENREHAHKIAEKVNKKGRKVFVTKTIPDGVKFV